MIRHFHEKLLLLQNQLHTKTGKGIGQERTLFIKAVPDLLGLMISYKRKIF